ncbi:hypothetical protein K6T82_17555 [Flavobacterium sp. 17A]|uniref:SGNH/GDSL hydrolase family protein n=1 Tax=Flavobacterium potami TaxID=2872310 RepID=A0A9X1HCF7_9FLAO|nr:hypothetical protein [Flavobacterium potami]MBZ4036581.1 hypothetical protein [Flavobacterium potami]
MELRKFILYVVKIIFLTCLLALILDQTYTYVFLNSKHRGKIEDVYNSQAEKYDVVILGSSRANNHFVAPMFEERGLKTYNYGMNGANLFEASLMLKLMIERKYQIKNIILETDVNLCFDRNSEGVSAKFLPYILNSSTIKNHFLNNSDFKYIYYIPFYRYIKNETKIGFRETFFTAIHKRGGNLDKNGYLALLETSNTGMKNNISNLNPLPHNKYYEEIKDICKKNNINFIAVMTPMCENTLGMNYFDKVKKAYPEIHNYENVVVEDRYFSSCGHMNDNGSRLFTARILKDFFNK